MAILVTGGLGHVGSWVVRKLVDQGEEVIVGDVIINRFKELNFDYLEEVEDQLHFEYLDIMDWKSIANVFNKYNFQLEGIIHTVALDPGEDAYKSLQVNTFGTLNMLEAARMFNIKKFTFISTGAVYGKTSGPIKETSPYTPTDVYGASKASGELMALQYGEKFNIDIKCPRLFFVYGPGKLPTRMNGLHEGLFGPLAGVKNASFEKGIDTYADFSYVEDVADGILKVHFSNQKERKIYNITSGVATGAKEIMKAVEEVIGYNPNISFGEGSWLERGAPLDISHAREDLDFDPKYVDIRKGIEKYYEWTKKVLAKEVPM